MTLAENLATNLADQLKEYDELLGAIWLYINWESVTRQLTTEQKELFADAIDRASEGGIVADRWWAETELGGATTRDLMRELAMRMQLTQNSDHGREIARLCNEGVKKLDDGVLGYRRDR